MTSRRNTIQKDLVRNAVCEMKRHVTANEVYEFVKEFCPTIGKGTVYRNLDILVEEGAFKKGGSSGWTEPVRPYIERTITM